MNKLNNFFKSLLPVTLFQLGYITACDIWYYNPVTKKEQIWYADTITSLKYNILYLNRNNYKITYIHKFYKK